MKTLKKIGFLFVMLGTAALTFNSCSDGGDDVVKPTLTLRSEVNLGYTFGDVTVTAGSPLKLGIVVTSTEKLETIEVIVENGANSDQVWDTTINDKTFEYDFRRNANSTVGAEETWTIVATDKKGNSAERSIVVTSKAAAADLTFSEDKMFFNIIGTKHGAYDLVSQATVAASAADGTKDIVDQTTGATFSKSWGSLNGSEFILNPAAVTFEAFKIKKYDAVEGAWNSNVAQKTTSVSGLKEGDIMLVKSGQSGNPIFLIRLHTITDGAGNDDSYTFDILGDY